MGNIAYFFKKHPFIALHVTILATAFISFRYYIERILTPAVGMGWAYVVDQIVPFIIAAAAAFFSLRRKIDLKLLRAKIKSHYLLLLLIFIVAFVIHLGFLYYFFWSDEVVYILRPITQNEGFAFHKLRSASMRGYFVLSYALTYLLFGLTAWVYPFLSITYFAISVLFVYWFSYLLIKRQLIATLTSLFFATTPAYLDMFTWHSTAHAPILILGLISFIFLLYYKRNGRFVYYILSCMFFFVAMKIGFVRSAGFAFVPLLLLFLPLHNRTKLKPRHLTLHALPYFVIALYFVLFEFFYLEIVTAVKISIKTGDFNQVFNFLLGYRGIEGNSSLFLPKLSYFTAGLFIPSGLVAEILPLFRAILPKVSIVLSLGILILLGMFASFIIALMHRHLKDRWLIIFAISFVILNMLHSVVGLQAPADFNPATSGFADSMDKHFTQESAGYGPGYRYLFISSVGVSLLFALFVTRLAEKGKILSMAAAFIYLFVLGGNVYFTIRAQVINIEGMTRYKSLVSNIFKIVPRDGKPKLLFSANPASNGLDRKFQGWEWLHGFYKIDEILYSTSPQEVSKLIKNAGYTRENLYAFYHNQHTLTFSDISEEARNYFFPGSQDTDQPISIEFSPKKKNSTERFIESKNLTLLERAVIASLPSNQQIISTQSLKFRLKIKRIENPTLPFSDTLFIEKDREYMYYFPLELWRNLESPPQVTSNLGVLRRSNDKSQLQVLNILKERENLMRSTSIDEKFAAGAVNVFNIEEGENITPKALIDGFYTTYPYPRPEEHYFVTKTNPLVLTLSLPYKIEVGRILINNLNSYSPATPKKIAVFASSNNKEFKLTTTIDNPTPSNWSPNKGSMYQLDLPARVHASSVQLVISGFGSPIAFDEIIIDGESASPYSPEALYETARGAYHYVDSKELLNKLSQSRAYDYLFVIWACADDSDWDKQLKNRKGLISGIWNTATVIIPSANTEVNDTIKINCYGSHLRKIFFVGPPYPVEMELVEAVLE